MARTDTDWKNTLETGGPQERKTLGASPAVLPEGHSQSGRTMWWHSHHCGSSQVGLWGFGETPGLREAVSVSFHGNSEGRVSEKLPVLAFACAHPRTCVSPVLRWRRS